MAGVLQELEGIHFRYGGEEFLCLLEITDETQAKHLADRLCSQIEQQKIPSSKPGRYLTVSAGYAVGTMKNDLNFAGCFMERTMPCTGQRTTEGTRLPAVPLAKTRPNRGPAGRQKPPDRAAFF